MLRNGFEWPFMYIKLKNYRHLKTNTGTFIENKAPGEQKQNLKSGKCHK